MPHANCCELRVHRHKTKKKDSFVNSAEPFVKLSLSLDIYSQLQLKLRSSLLIEVLLVLRNNQTIKHRFALAFVIFVHRLGTINGQLTMNITYETDGRTEHGGEGGTYAGICGEAADRRHLRLF